MGTKHKLMEPKNEDIAPHNCVEETDTNIPICVVHLKVERSEVIDITERGALMNVKYIKSESYSDIECVKQELQVDTGGYGLISAETIKQEEVERHLDIANAELTNNEYLKQEPSEEIDIDRNTLTGVEAVKEELSEEIVLIETDLSEELKQKGLVTAAENYKSKKSEGVARTERSLVEIRPFGCDICQQRFIRKCRLNEHLRIHVGDKPFQCGICQQGFTVMDNLSVHMRTHTGYKSLKCEICQRTFAKKTNLNAHLRVHAGGKPFECEICLQGFKQKSYLNAHLRTHTGAKPFKCEICLQGYTQKHNLNKHLRTHRESF